MTAKENIVSRIEKLTEYIGYLKTYQKIPLSQIQKDYTIQGAVCHYFQLSVECVIDIGELLISSLKLRKPADAHEVIIILSENGILEKSFAKKIAPMTGFRNILVHEYLKVDLKEVYRHLQKDLKDFDYFAKKVTQYLKKR